MTSTDPSYSLSSSTAFARERERLPRQARVAFPTERPILERFGLGHCVRILDLGCGEGSHLAELRRAFPNATVAGIDRNEALLEIARQRVPEANFQRVDLLDPQPLGNAIRRFRPDAVLLRLVLQHLPPNAHVTVLQSIRQNARDARLFVIDSLDAMWSARPSTPLFPVLMSRLAAFTRERGGDRSVGRRVERLLRDAGYRVVSSARCSIGVDHRDRQALGDVLLPLFDAVGVGSEAERLRHWYRAGGTLEAVNVIASAS